MRAVIIGVRQQGKSTFALHLAQQHADGVLIFDPNHQFRRFPSATTTDELAEFVEQAEGKSVIVFVPGVITIKEDFEIFGSWVRENLRGNYALVLDEADELQGRMQMEPQLQWFIRRAPTGRDGHNNVHLFQTTHSPQDIYTRARNLVTDFYIFRMQGVAEVEAIRQQCGDEVAEISRNLPEFHIVHCWTDPGGLLKNEVLTSPADWYIEIGIPQQAMKTESESEGANRSGAFTGNAPLPPFEFNNRAAAFVTED